MPLRQMHQVFPLRHAFSTRDGVSPFHIGEIGCKQFLASISSLPLCWQRCGNHQRDPEHLLSPASVRRRDNLNVNPNKRILLTNG